jgi:hypothetical protein
MPEEDTRPRTVHEANEKGYSEENLDVTRSSTLQPVDYLFTAYSTLVNAHPTLDNANPFIDVDAHPTLDNVHPTLGDAHPTLDDAGPITDDAHPGQQKIRSREYAFQETSTSRQISLSDPWEASFRLGRTVDMSMVYADPNTHSTSLNSRHTNGLSGEPPVELVSDLCSSRSLAISIRNHRPGNMLQPLINPHKPLSSTYGAHDKLSHSPQVHSAPMQSWLEEREEPFFFGRTVGERLKSAAQKFPEELKQKRGLDTTARPQVGHGSSARRFTSGVRGSSETAHCDECGASFHGKCANANLRRHKNEQHNEKQNQVQNLQVKFSPKYNHKIMAHNDPNSKTS